ncbi:SAM-dependent methyltransferase [Burkholderia ubonensis]|uniref:RsmB/NOP family class I SAM-dependent RNA methyltransferase n=1 Tax=Burkholderia ubonensis TaxID=101571 RepID=UPI0007588A97|nr:RsmB/NOP family class I SAM-dependent RNA methyltransferase [Burkholderia ubonensis]KVD67055.1 SAM-dependent methyltransferase [Burkholderia ubonensis]
MKLHGFLIGQTETLLAEVLKFAGPADATTSRFFRAHPKLGHAERGVIAEAVFAVLRRKMEYAHLAESGTGSPARRLTLLGLMQTAGRNALKPFVSDAEAAWLEHVSKIDPASLPVRVRANLPDWIQQALSSRFDAEELAQLAAAMNYPAPLDLRANAQKATRDQVIDALRANGIDAGATPFAPFGVRVAGKPALTKLKVFEEGMIEVQDEGSQLLCSLVAPRRGEMVVDFCAGAGGKTLALGAMMRSTGRLYAFDVSEKRLAKLKPRLARSGLSNVNPVLIDSEHDAKIKRLAGKIDRVLVDAPCSGLGTLRRNPDLKWRQSRASIDELTPKQASILASAARLVKKGGRLVYATCSVLDAENEVIVAQFLADHPEFMLVPAQKVLADQRIALDTGDYLSLWPHRHATDGFFAAVLERRGQAAQA